MKTTIISAILVPMILAVSGAAYAGHIVITTLADKDTVSMMAEQVMVQAYGRLGLSMELEYLPGERALQTANAGQVDGELMRMQGIEHAYPNLIRVPVVISQAEQVVFTKGKHFPIQGWQSLVPYKMGYIRGVKAIEANLVPGTRTIPVRTYKEEFRQLDAGITDAVVEVRSVGMVAIKELGLKGIDVLEPPLIKVPLYHYLHRKNQHLVGDLTAVLEQMDRDGTIREIHRKVMQSIGQ